MNKTSQYAAILITAALAGQSASARPLGIDVSSYQGSINWSSVYANGVTFAYAKATQGMVSQDSEFKTYMKNGKAAGLLMGAYDFAEPYADTPAQDANYFWSFAGTSIIADGKSLQPAVDVSVFSGHVGTSTYTQWVNDWATDVINDGAAAGVTLHPILETGTCTSCSFGTNLTLGLWLVNDNGESYGTGSPWDGASCSCHNNAWIFWGFGTGAIGGIAGPVDMDTYHGTLAELKTNEVVLAK